MLGLVIYGLFQSDCIDKGQRAHNDRIAKEQQSQADRIATVQGTQAAEGAESTRVALGRIGTSMAHIATVQDSQRRESADSRRDAAARAAAKKAADEEDRRNTVAALDAELVRRFAPLLDSLKAWGTLPVSPGDIHDADQNRVRHVWDEFLKPRDPESQGAAGYSTLALMEGVQQREPSEAVRLATIHLRAIAGSTGQGVWYISSTGTIPDTFMLGFRDLKSPPGGSVVVRRSQMDVLRMIAIPRWVPAGHLEQ